MPRALVTGASGFVGGHLARHLARVGWEVHALTRSAAGGVEAAGATVRHVHDGTTAGMIRLVEAARPDVVFHLASLFLAEHRPEDVEPLIQSNLLLGTQLAEAMAVRGAGRLVNTGTSWQHYGGPGYRPVNLYAATKQAFEDLLAWYHDARGLSVITLKLYDTYGPDDRRRKLIRILLEAARSGEPLAMSPGEQELELLHVDDASAAFTRAAELLLATEAPLRASYLVPGTRLTLQALVARVERASGRRIQVEWGGRPYRNREVMKPVEAAGSTLPGWAPQVELDAGLRRLAVEAGGLP